MRQTHHTTTYPGFGSYNRTVFEVAATLACALTIGIEHGAGGMKAYLDIARRVAVAHYNRAHKESYRNMWRKKYPTLRYTSRDIFIGPMHMYAGMDDHMARTDGIGERIGRKGFICDFNFTYYKKKEPALMVINRLREIDRAQKEVTARKQMEYQEVRYAEVAF